MIHNESIDFDFSMMDGKQAQAMLHLIFELLPDGVVLIDAREFGTVVSDCNAAFARMNGYEREELINQPFDILHLIDAPAPATETPENAACTGENSSFDAAAFDAAAYIDEVRRAGVLRGYSVHRRKNGTLFTIEFRSRVVNIAGRDYVLGIDRDLSFDIDFKTIQKSEETLRAIFEATPDGIVLIDPAQDTFYIYECNQAFCRMNGYTRDELVGRPIKSLDVAVEEVKSAGLELVFEGTTSQNDAMAQNTAGAVFNPAWHKRKNGSIMAIEYTTTMVRIEGRKMILGLDHDITQRRREEHFDFRRNRVLELIATNAPLARSLGEIERLIEGQFIGIQCALLVLQESLPTASLRALAAEPATAPTLSTATISPAAPTLHWQSFTEKARHLFGHVALHNATILRQACAQPVFVDLASPASLEISSDVLVEALPDATQLRIEPITGIHGTLGCLILWSHAEKSDAGNDEADLSLLDKRMRRVMSTALRLTAISVEQHTMSQRLAFQAERDLLTGLPNRYLFEDRLSHALARAKRRETRIALLFLDLDGFKNVNDSLGHYSGDCILQEVARRLQACVRASDTVARLGGDEFTLIIDELKNLDGAEKVARKIVNALQKPFHIENHEVRITVSIGIVVSPDDSSDINDLIRYADGAMYEAKNRGKNRYQSYRSAANVAIGQS